MNDLLKAAVLGVVEGVTGSADKLDRASHHEEGFHRIRRRFANSFKILIQLGAVLAVVVYFRRRLFLRRFRVVGGKTRRGIYG